MCAHCCLCLSFLTQICVSALVLVCWNLTARTTIDLYYKAQLNSIMAYDIAKFCQKCQKLHIIFCLFRKLCCLFSLFLLALCPEMYFWVIRNPCLVLKLCFILVETRNDSPSYFLSSGSSRAQTGIMLVITSDFLFSVQKCTEYIQAQPFQTSGSSRPKVQRWWEYEQSYNYPAYGDICMLHVLTTV